MASTTLRLPDALKAEADAYAATLGISLNALCAVALRDYLLERAPVPASEAPRAESAQRVASAVLAACGRGQCPVSLRERPEVEAVPREAGHLTK